jgi:hypothetical protein
MMMQIMLFLQACTRQVKMRSGAGLHGLQLQNVFASTIGGCIVVYRA